VKRKTVALTFALALLFSSVVGLMYAQTAIANPGFLNSGPSIVISSDGTVSPDTEGIQHDGNNYFLTKDINGYSLYVECSNIVIDGKGHLLNSTPYTNHPIFLKLVANVTIKNLKVEGTTDIAATCSNCKFENITFSKQISLSESNFNNIINCNAGINIYGSNNTIMRNNITQLIVWGSHTKSNVFSENNFLCLDWIFYADSFFDNGSVGNYWTGYNGTDANGDGIGDIPFILNEKNTASYLPNRPEADNIDNYPLIYPYDIENDKIVLPASVPPQAQSSIIAFAAGICAISIAVAMTVLICYQKKWGGPKKHDKIY
jgi:hypothetical protein